MIVIVAGLGNLFGVILAGFGLGVAEKYSGFILGAQFQQATVVVLLVHRARRAPDPAGSVTAARCI